jgi:hypothetical protein
MGHNPGTPFGVPMTNMRCLCIGISDAPPLEFLQGAVNGARAFAQWTRDRGIQTEILTDEENPVNFQNVLDAFGRLFAAHAAIDRLLVYFAGHGLTRDAGEDLWLLSQWFPDQRAIAVMALRRQLERYGIKQISIIGDACRSLPNDEDNACLTPDAVLKRGPFDRTTPRIDVLNASKKFRAAYMVPGQTPEEDRCIFSGVLEEALSGAKAEAFDGGRITSMSLVKFLIQEVQNRAAIYNVRLEPDVTPGFLSPDDVYVDAMPAAPPALKPWPQSNAAVLAAMSASNASPARGGKRGWSTRRSHADEAAVVFSSESESRRGASPFTVPGAEASVEGEQTAPVSAEEVARMMEQRAQAYTKGYQEEFRPSHFETGAGFATEGSRARRIALGHFAFASESGQKSPDPKRVFSWWSVSNQGGAPYLSIPAPLLIELDNGRWCGAAALPGFIGTFTVGNGGATSLIYRRTYSPPDSGQESEAAVAELRAGLLATDAAYDAAARFRDEKESDPVKGVLAAYLYDAQGDVESVRRTAFYFFLGGLPIPFDMAVLGRLRVTQIDGKLVATIPETAARAPRSKAEETRSWTHNATGDVNDVLVAGAFPWLRQGWALLDGDESWMLPGLTELNAHLLPFQFTTLDAGGGKALYGIINSGP